MKKRASKEPYEGYKLPRSSEKGQPFVDFNKVLRNRPIKRIIKRRKRNDRKESKRLISVS